MENTYPSPGSARSTHNDIVAERNTMSVDDIGANSSTDKLLHSDNLEVSYNKKMDVSTRVNDEVEDEDDDDDDEEDDDYDDVRRDEEGLKVNEHGEDDDDDDDEDDDDEDEGEGRVTDAEAEDKELTPSMESPLTSSVNSFLNFHWVILLDTSVSMAAEARAGVSIFETSVLLIQKFIKTEVEHRVYQTSFQGRKPTHSFNAEDDPDQQLDASDYATENKPIFSLITYEEGPGCYKVLQKNADRVLEVLPYLKPVDSTPADVALGVCYDFLASLRCAYGLEQFGLGRFPRPSLPCGILWVTDGRLQVKHLGGSQINDRLSDIPMQEDSMEATVRRSELSPQQLDQNWKSAPLFLDTTKPWKPNYIATPEFTFSVRSDPAMLAYKHPFRWDQCQLMVCLTPHMLNTPDTLDSIEKMAEACGGLSFRETFPITKPKFLDPVLARLRSTYYAGFGMECPPSFPIAATYAASTDISNVQQVTRVMVRFCEYQERPADGFVEPRQMIAGKAFLRATEAQPPINIPIPDSIKYSDTPNEGISPFIGSRDAIPTLYFNKAAEDLDLSLLPCNSFVVEAYENVLLPIKEGRGGYFVHVVDEQNKISHPFGYMYYDKLVAAVYFQIYPYNFPWLLEIVMRMHALRSDEQMIHSISSTLREYLLSIPEYYVPIVKDCLSLLKFDVFWPTSLPPSYRLDDIIAENKKYSAKALEYLRTLQRAEELNKAKLLDAENVLTTPKTITPNDPRYLTRQDPRYWPNIAFTEFGDIPYESYPLSERRTFFGRPLKQLTKSLPPISEVPEEDDQENVDPFSMDSKAISRMQLPASAFDVRRTSVLRTLHLYKQQFAKDVLRTIDNQDTGLGHKLLSLEPFDAVPSFFAYSTNIKDKRTSELGTHNAHVKSAFEADTNIDEDDMDEVRESFGDNVRMNGESSPDYSKAKCQKLIAHMLEQRPGEPQKFAEPLRDPLSDEKWTEFMGILKYGNLYRFSQTDNHGYIREIKDLVTFKRQMKISFFERRSAMMKKIKATLRASRTMAPRSKRERAKDNTINQEHYDFSKLPRYLPMRSLFIPPTPPAFSTVTGGSWDREIWTSMNTGVATHPDHTYDQVSQPQAIETHGKRESSQERLSQQASTYQDDFKSISSSSDETSSIKSTHAPEDNADELEQTMLEESIDMISGATEVSAGVNSSLTLDTTAAANMQNTSPSVLEDYISSDVDSGVMDGEFDIDRIPTSPSASSPTSRSPTTLPSPNSKDDNDSGREGKQLKKSGISPISPDAFVQLLSKDPHTVKQEENGDTPLPKVTVAANGNKVNTQGLRIRPRIDKKIPQTACAIEAYLRDYIRKNIAMVGFWNSGSSMTVLRYMLSRIFVDNIRLMPFSVIKAVFTNIITDMLNYRLIHEEKFTSNGSRHFRVTHPPTKLMLFKPPTTLQELYESENSRANFLTTIGSINKIKHLKLYAAHLVNLL